MPSNIEFDKRSGRMKSQEIKEGVTKKNKPSGNVPQNIQQCLLNRSQNATDSRQQQQQQRQQPQQQQQNPQQRQDNPQQQQGNATRVGRPSLLVRKGTLRQSKQRKTQPEKKRQKKRMSLHIENKISKVQLKIKEELKITESQGNSLLGKAHTCKNILYFVIVYSVLLCLRSAVESYTEGMAHQVEQKYYFSYSSMDVLGGVKLMGFLSSMTYVVFFTRTSHKPLVIFWGVLICSVGAMVWSVPYFIDHSYSQSLTQCGDQPTVGFYYSEMCQYRNKSRLVDVTLSNGDICSACVLKNKDPWWQARETRFSVMSFGGFLIGIGTGLFATMGIVYIEENGEQNACPIYYGILMCMTGLGKFIGSCLVWWFHGYSEDLLVKDTIQSYEIKAWWLGMVILSIFLFLISWIFLIFPKWLTEPFWICEKRERKMKYLNLYLNYLTTKYKRRKSISDSIRRTNRRSKKGLSSARSPSQPQNIQNQNSTIHPNINHLKNEQVIEMPSNGVNDIENNCLGVSGLNCKETVRNLQQVVISNVEIEDPNDKNVQRMTKPRRESKKLGKRCSRLREIFTAPGFSLVLLGVCFAAYFPAGYRTSVSSYVHHQYQFPPIHSWFYTMGLSYSLAWCIGPGIAGLVIHRLQLNLRKQLMMIMILLMFHISIFFFMFPISCNPRMDDFSNSSIRHCMDVCSCSYVQREAVCTPDGTMYSSPCHASCSLSLSCNCTNTLASSNNCVSNCPIYGLYWVLLFVATLFFSMGSVGVILFFLRTVDDDYKTMSISLAFWMIIVAAYVPGTAVFRGIAESSCSGYMENCLSEQICSSYTPDKFRYLMNGSNIAFQSGAFVVFLIIFILSTKRKIRFGEDFDEGLRISFQENADDLEREIRSQTRGPKKHNTTRIRGIEGGEKQEDKLRRHLQVVEEVERRVELEKSSSNPDIAAGRIQQEITPTSSSNFQEGMTNSNDSSTKKLIEASKQQPKPTPFIQLQIERPLSNKEMVEHYLSSIPDEFVYSRHVSMENDEVVPGRIIDPVDVRLGVDNLAYDHRELPQTKPLVSTRGENSRKNKFSNPDEILFM